MLPYQIPQTVRFCAALFEGESGVRIIFSLSPRPGTPAKPAAKQGDRPLGTKFEMQAPGLKEEKR